MTQESRARDLMPALSGIALIFLLMGCDAISLGPKIPKCDDGQTILHIAELARSQRQQALSFTWLEGYGEVPISELTFSTAERILVDEIDESVGKVVCSASFIYKYRANPAFEWVSTSVYVMQYDSKGELYSGLRKRGDFVSREVDIRIDKSHLQ